MGYGDDAGKPISVEEDEGLGEKSSSSSSSSSVEVKGNDGVGLARGK